MLIFNVPKEYPDLISDINKTFDNSEIVEVDSLEAEIIVQVIVPIITVAVPAVVSIILKAMSISSKVEVEWDGIKIKGTEKQVEKFIEKISNLKETKSGNNN